LLGVRRNVFAGVSGQSGGMRLFNRLMALLLAASAVYLLLP
jgi:hypothetical protein